MRVNREEEAFGMRGIWDKNRYYMGFFLVRCWLTDFLTISYFQFEIGAFSPISLLWAHYYFLSSNVLWIFDVIDSRILPDISIHIYSSYSTSPVQYSFARVKTASFQKFSSKDECVGPSLRFLFLIIWYLFVGNKPPDSGRELAAYYATESWGQHSEPGLWSHRYPMRQTLFNIQS